MSALPYLFRSPYSWGNRGSHRKRNCTLPFWNIFNCGFLLENRNNGRSRIHHTSSFAGNRFVHWNIGWIISLFSQSFTSLIQLIKWTIITLNLGQILVYLTYLYVWRKFFLTGLKIMPYNWLNSFFVWIIWSFWLFWSILAWILLQNWASNSTILAIFSGVCWSEM